MTWPWSVFAQWYQVCVLIAYHSTPPQWASTQDRCASGAPRTPSASPRPTRSPGTSRSTPASTRRRQHPKTQFYRRAPWWWCQQGRHRRARWCWGRWEGASVRRISGRVKSACGSASRWVWGLRIGEGWGGTRRVR